MIKRRSQRKEAEKKSSKTSAKEETRLNGKRRWWRTKRSLKQPVNSNFYWNQMLETRRARLLWPSSVFPWKLQISIYMILNYDTFLWYIHLFRVYSIPPRLEWADREVGRRWEVGKGPGTEVELGGIRRFFRCWFISISFCELVKKTHL